MAVVSITGSQFTFKIGTTDYTAQVTSGTITATPSIARTKTLSDTAFPLVDLVHEVQCDFLYDDEVGFQGQLNTAAVAGTGLTTEIVGGDGKWSGTLYCTGLETKVSAADVAMSSASFVGSLTYADKP